MVTKMVRSAPAATGIKQILVRCATTGKLNVTGQTIEESRFATAKLKKTRLTCAHCGQVHNWTKKDVVLARQRAR
jgi:hypothetical protein